MQEISRYIGRRMKVETSNAIQMTTQISVANHLSSVRLHHHRSIDIGLQSAASWPQYFPYTYPTSRQFHSEVSCESPSVHITVGRQLWQG